MTRGAFLWLVISATALPGCDRSPRGFTAQSYDKAQAEARSSGRLFLVDSTADWCPPCRRMERETWTDERVISWIDKHAVAVKLDVDRDPDRAGTLRIEAMPTIVVFRDGAEFDRIVGYKSADDLLTWLDGVLQGRREIDALRHAAGDRTVPGERVDVQARYQLAVALVGDGAFDEATEEFAWLWDHMLEHSPASYGVRLSFMVGEMQDLARRHEPARQAFRALRDRERASVDRVPPDHRALIDWIHLNEVIGDDEDTIAWFNRVRSRPAAASMFEPIDHELFELLIARELWADAGAIYSNPDAELLEAIEFDKSMEEADPDLFDPREQQAMAAFRREDLRQQASRLYAACLAAARDDAAAQVAWLLMREQDDAAARAALVEAALSAGQPRSQHRRWLDDAQARGVPQQALRRRLDEALAGN